MQAIFNLCVDILLWLAKLTGTTYVEINVIIFCIILPVILCLMVAAIIGLALYNIRLRKERAALYKIIK